MVESIVSLNTELEVAIRYPQPRRLTATAVPERPVCLSHLISISAKNATNWQHSRKSDELSRPCSPDYHGLEGLQTCTDAQMPPCPASTFTPERVNILVFLLVTCFILATSRSHACAYGFLLTDIHYSAFNRDSSYLSLE